MSISFASSINFTEEFPVIGHYTYLNTASSGLLPKQLVKWRQQHDQDFLKEGSLFRDSHKFHIWEIKEDVARFFQTSKERVALVPNFSFGMNMLLEGLPKGSKVLLIQGDYPSINWPVEFRDFEVASVTLDEHLEEHLSEAFEKYQPHVFLCSIVQYISGVLLDLEFLKSLKQQYPETLFVGDGTQYFGTARFNFEASAFDVVGASTYKWLLAGYGNGFFLVKPSVAKKVFPKTIGFNSADAVYGKKDDINFIGRMEPGHQDTLNYGTLGQAIRFLEAIGMERIETYLSDFSKMAHRRFLEFGLLEPLIANRKKHSTIFNIKGDAALFQKLKDSNILTSQRGKGIRVGFHFYNTSRDLDQMIQILGN